MDEQKKLTNVISFAKSNNLDLHKSIDVIFNEDYELFNYLTKIKHKEFWREIYNKWLDEVIVNSY